MWLEEQVPGLAGEIYFYQDPHTGTPVGERWREALRQASSRCEAVICLVSPHWLESGECIAEYAQAEYLNKRVFSARIARLTSEEEGKDPTRQWQHFDLVSDGCAESSTEVDISDGGQPVRLATEGLQRLRDGIVRAGIGTQYFRWPPLGDPERAPYRGCQRAMRSRPQLQDHYPCRRWPSPPSDTQQTDASTQLDSSFPALAATVGRCFGHVLDTICDLRVEIDGHRIKVAVEEIRIDPQRDTGIFVAEHPRHRKDIRAGTDSQTRATVPQIVRRDLLHLRALDRPIEPPR